MTRYPAAFCHDCEKFLSPQGSQKMAEEARESHERTEMKFRGVRHSVSVYRSAETFREPRP